MKNKFIKETLKLTLSAAISFIAVGLVSLIKGNLSFDISLMWNEAIIALLGTGTLSILFMSKTKAKKIILGIISILVLGMMGISIWSSPIFSAKEHRELIGEVSKIDFSKEIQPVNLDTLPTIDEEVARNVVDKKLGEVPALGSQVKIGELTLQTIDGELYYVAPLEHSSLLKSIMNNSGTGGYVKVNAKNPADAELVTELEGKPINLKYTNSGFLFNNIRIKSFFANNTVERTDFSFELDDEGNPYWIISLLDSGVNVTEKKVVGTLVISAIDGSSESYKIEETPEWIDRVQPMGLVKGHIDKFGKLVHGAFNFSGKDKLTTTKGMNVIVNEGKTYYYTGMTSVGNDESLTGFALVDSKSGETTIYNTSGATETAAMKSGEGKYQEKELVSTFPYLINIQGEPTYFMMLKDNAGLVKQYAMVNVKNYSLVGGGDTVQNTLNNYLDILSSTGASLSGANTVEKVSGTIEKIGLVIKAGSSIYDIKLSGSDKIYSISTDLNREAALFEKGDTLEVEFIPVGGKYTLAKSAVKK